MTQILILSDDFEILFEDETVGGNAVAGMKMVRRTSGAGSTVYTTNALYSAIADAADDFQAMGFENPMLPVTPNAYTMENNYFIPRSSTEFLDEGAISADWTVTSGEGVFVKSYVAVAAAFVAADIGRQLTETDTGDTGTLLDFETLPDGTTVVWIRPDTAGDTFADTNSQLEVTGDGGTGDVTTGGSLDTAVSGLSLWPSIQAIGSVPTATEVYLYQERVKMTSSTGAFQWWTTDPTVSLGIIDILIRTTIAGTVIADGDVEVFARRYTSQYDNFRLNVATGGRSALPLASAPDINNTTGYRRLTSTGATGTGTFVVGEVVNEAVSLAAGVLTAVGGTSADPVLEYYLVSDETIDIFSSGAQTVTGATSGATVTSEATTANLLGPTDPAAGEGGTVTLALGGFLVDHTGDGTTEPYSVQFDCQSDVAIAKVYERIKYVTRRGAPNTDLFGAGANIPGESYRGLDALFEYDANTGTMTEGDDVDVAADWTARLLHQNTTNTPTYITVTDQQTSLDAVVDNDVIDDESGDDVTVHAGGSVGLVTIASVKASPFGTFTGTQIFGARGVSFINFDTGDEQSYILTDDLGVLNNPPNTVTFTVTNSLTLDRILVARDTGTAGEIDKDQFGGLDTPATTYNGLADLEIRVAGSVDTEVPQAGFVRVVETTLQEEHHYVYDSRTTGALGVFTLRPIDDDGTITTGSSTNLIDTSANFNSPQVTIGMLVRNTFAGKTVHVWEVTAINSATDLSVRQLYGPLDATQDWDVGDTFTINALIGDHTVPGDYAVADDVFDLILDLEADATSESNSFIKTLSADFDVVVNVRQGKIILPFTINQTVGDGNTVVSTVRTTDTIAT